MNILVTLAKGQFPPSPKIQAAVEFVEQGGKRAVACRPEGLGEALDGRGGTVVNKYISAHDAYEHNRR